MLLGALITSGAYTLASLGHTASLPTGIAPFLLVVFALLGAAHMATRRLAPHAEATLLPLAALLNGIGYVFIARLDHRETHLASFCRRCEVPRDAYDDARLRVVEGPWRAGAPDAVRRRRHAACQREGGDQRCRRSACHAPIMP
jgi:hypothetical protein